jgi:DeoR/GlpR family transcriptional regulator of sugar metabolism
MVRRTRGEVVVMADHTKIGLVCDLVVCPLDQVDLLVVDDEVDTDVCARISQVGPRCEVVQANPLSTKG